LDYSKVCSPVVEILRGELGPRRIGADEFSGELGYTYHFDATKLADLLKDVATKRGVVHILDDVDRIEQDERGFISKLHLRERGEHKVEFVIDCTGFRGVIAQQTLGESFLSYDKYLLNDRAAVIQVPHENPKIIEPATRSTALSAGWNFRIPMKNRLLRVCF
ncbi:MAG TPA: tryptophan 7-halogenase, partial [Alphaproteobacteria bacterium]|nr:tryptophan 7-halogenase [Alphaproteobacteria bacterium]